LLSLLPAVLLQLCAGTTAPWVVRAGYGLSGMRERVEMMGGRLTLDSAPGGGFALEARWPVAAEPA